MLLIAGGLLALMAVLLWVVLPRVAIDLVNASLVGRASWTRLRITPHALAADGVRLDNASGDCVMKAAQVVVRFSLLDMVRHRSLVPGIREVEVAEPELFLERRADGSFNLERVLRPSEAMVELEHLFRGIVRVPEGSLVLADRRFGVETAVRLTSAVVDMSDLEHCRAELGLLERGPQGVKITAVASWKRDLVDTRARVSLEGLEVARAMGYAMALTGVKQAPISVRAGRLKLSALLSTVGPLRTSWDSLHVTGTAWAEGLAGRVEGRPLEFRDGRLLAFLTRDMIDIRRFTVRIGRDALELAGRLFDRRQPQLDLELRLRSPSIASSLRAAGFSLGLALDGSVRGSVRLRGALNGPPVAQVSLASPRLMVAGRRLRDATARIFWTSGTWRVEQMRAVADGGGTVEAQGWVLGGDGRRMMLDVRARDARLAALFGAQAGAAARASVDVTLIGAPGNPLVLGEGRLRDASVNGVDVSEVSGRFVCSRSAVIVSDVRATTAAGRFRTPVGYLGLGGDREIFARVEGEGISRALGGAEVQDASLSLTVAGRARDLYAAGRVRAASVRAAGMSMRGFDGVVAASRHTVCLLQGALGLGPRAVSLTGTVLPDVRAFEVTASSDGMGVETRGRYDSRSLRGLAYGRALDASLLRAFGLKPWFPRGRVDVMALFALDHSTRGVDLDLVGRSGDLHVGGISFDRLALSASLLDQALAIRTAFLSGPAAVITLAGAVPLRERGAWALRWSADVAHLGKVVNALEVGTAPARLRSVLLDVLRLRSLAGHAFVHGEVRGSRQAVRVDGHVLADKARLHGEPLFAQADFRAHRGGLVVRSGRVVVGGDQVDVAGSVGLDRLPVLDLSVSTPQLWVQRALGFTPYSGVASKGWLEGKVRVTGRVDRLAAAGRVRLHGVTVENQPVDEAEVVLRAAPDRIVVEGLRARLGGGVITGRGDVRVRGPVDLMLSARAFPLRELVALRGSPLEQGHGDVDLGISGTLAHPRYALDLDLQGLGPPERQVGLRASGKVRLSGRRVDVEGLRVGRDGAPGEARLDGSLELARQGLPATFGDLLAARGSLEASLQDAPLRTLLGFKPGRRVDISGLLNGNVKLSGALGRPRVEGAVEARDVRSAGFDVGLVRLSGALDSAASTIEGAELTVRGGAGTLLASASADKDSGRLSLQANDLEVAALAPLAPWSFPFAGRLDASFDASGPLFEPVLGGRFELSEGRVAALAFDQLSGALSGRQGSYRLERFVARKGAHRAELSGGFSLAYRNGELVSPSPVDLKASITESSLDVLSLFIPDMQSSPGRLRARLFLSGTYPDTRLTGELTVRDGVIRNKRLANPIENLNMNVTLDGRRLEIKNTSGSMGRGVFTVSGGADLAGLGLSDINLGLKASGLGLTVAPYLASVVDADLHLVGSSANPSLVGSVTAQSARVSLPLSSLARAGGGLGAPSGVSSPAPQGGGPASVERLADGGRSASAVAASDASLEDRRAPFSLPPVTFSVDLNLGRDAWLQFLGSAVRVEGQLALVGKGDKAAPAGQVTLQQGQIRIPLFPVSLRLTGGRAYFDPTAGWMPNLAAAATAQVGDYQVYVDVRGTASDPDVRLSSNPPLPQGAIRQLLLGGTTAQQGLMGPTGFTQNQSMGLGALFTVAQATFLQPITSFIGRIFGVSEVTLELVQQGGIMFTVYRALDLKQKLNVLFSAVQGTVPEGLPRNLYGFEYRFSPSHLVRMSSDNLGGFHFFYQRRWRF
ncbi:MAG: hypothetical protein EB084_09105 [Proteobacteria bacterium]|nr:hypothetical protein [Pseudomonadota bacterium]